MHKQHTTNKLNFIPSTSSMTSYKSITTFRQPSKLSKLPHQLVGPLWSKKSFTSNSESMRRLRLLQNGLLTFSFLRPPSPVLPLMNWILCFMKHKVNILLLWHPSDKTPEEQTLAMVAQQHQRNKKTGNSM